MRKAKIRNIVVCLTLAAAMLLGGCASENTVDTSSKADNGSNASDVSVNQSDASLGASDTSNDVSVDVSDTSNDSSVDVSDTSDDNSKEDQSSPENPTAAGKDVMDELLEYLPGLYAEIYHTSYQEAANRLQNIDFKTFGIDTLIDYDSSIDAGTGVYYDGFDFIPCIAWGIRYEDMNGRQKLNLFLPPEHPAMIAIREKMGVAPNNLSKLMFTEEEILALDSETAQLLLDLIEASKNYTVYEEPENTPEAPTVTGEDVMDELLEYLPGLYAKRYYTSYEEAANILQNIDFKTFGIDTLIDYDSSIDAGTGEYYDGFDFIPCVAWGIRYEDMNGRQKLNLFLPPEHPAMIAIREKMGVAPNNLSKLMFTEEEILALDGETAQFLLDLIEASKNYTVYKEPENQPSL